MSKLVRSCSVTLTVSAAALSVACSLVACGGDDQFLVIGDTGDASVDSGAPDASIEDASDADDAGDAANDAAPAHDATLPDGGSEGGADAALDATADGAADGSADAAADADASADAGADADAGTDAGVDSGVEAALDVTTDLNLSTTSTGTRTCADGGDMVAYTVSALVTAAGATTATLGAAPSAGCLSPGDSVVLIDLQGTPAATVNVGTYELLTVASVTANAVLFTGAKTGFYGATTGDDTLATQHVVIQRVPLYASITVETTGTLTASGWNGTTGGIFAASSIGDVTVNGVVTMSGLGFVGAPQTTVALANGTQGESYDGAGLGLRAANLGAGGGGLGDPCATFGVGGGGGGYSAAGAEAAYGGTCAGLGGNLYGSATLATVFLGSGGGSGGEDNSVTDNPPGGYGGNGGGIVYLSTSGNVVLGATGVIAADGAAGQGDVGNGFDCGSTTSCWDYAGPGGGGAGGSVLIRAATMTGTGTVTAAGGAGGLSETGNGPAGNGGAGSTGYVVHP